MKILRAIIALILAVAVQSNPFLQWEAKNLGIPAADSYSDTQTLARSVWDMAVCDGILYVGTGDFSANTGPTSIWAYNLSGGTWSVSTTVSDEAVSRFCMVGDTLFAPGIDATDSSWEYGNYHTLTDGRWTSFEKLPGAVHNFDISRFGGSRFFSLGTADGETAPVLISADGKTGFQPVQFRKDGVSVLDGRYSFTRVYDFFVLNDRMYCLFCGYEEDGTIIREFYEYTGGSFTYMSDADLDYFYCKQLPVCGKAVVDGIQYFATGKLYRTDDFQTITPVELPDNGFVTDIYIYKAGEDRFLYALSNTKNDGGTYTATVYLLDGGITAIADYTARAPALSLVTDGADFYIGLGGVEESSDSGAVIRLRVPDTVDSE